MPTTPLTKSDSRRIAAIAILSQFKAWLIIAATFVLAVAMYYLLPETVNELARRSAAIFVVAAIFWATEVIPLFATSLLLIAMQIFFLAHAGGLADLFPAYSNFPVADDGTALELNYTTFLKPFSSGIIILFMGGFLLSAAVSKTCLDRVIASKVLHPFAARPLALLFAVLGISAFFSMWMSNTATAAMMIAIIMPLVRDVPKGDRFHRGMILAAAFGANIGGIGTPIGTPPNAVGMAILRNAGIEITFLEWMIVAVPLELLLLAATGFILYFSFKPSKGLVLGGVKTAATMNRKAWITMLIMVSAIALWLTSSLHGLDEAVIALSAAAALCTFGILSRHDVDSIDWNILILMWGGLALGNAMQETQLVNYVTSLPFSELSDYWLAVVVVIVAVTLSTFMSNTAAANLLIPMAVGVAVGVEAKLQLGILTALACSFAMAMPVSTPPNAIAYGTGEIPAQSMLRVGGFVSVICIVLLLLGFQWVLPLFLPAQ